MISSDLGKFSGLSHGPICPLPFSLFSLDSSSDVLLEDVLELLTTFGAILLRNKKVLKTSLML